VLKTRPKYYESKLTGKVWVSLPDTNKY